MVPRVYTFCYRVEKVLIFKPEIKYWCSITFSELIIIMCAINAVYATRYFKILGIDAMRIYKFLRTE